MGAWCARSLHRHGHVGAIRFQGGGGAVAPGLAWLALSLASLLSLERLFDPAESVRLLAAEMVDLLGMDDADVGVQGRHRRERLAGGTEYEMKIA